MRSRSAFTLIELLVVIAIIGALSAMALPNFMAAREKARDATRKSDLRELKTALELYKQDQSDNSYPSALPTNGLCWSSTGSGTSCPDSAVYMKLVPQDPNRQDSGGASPYWYEVGSPPSSYSLCTCIENPADPKATAGNCDDTSYVCDSGVKFTVTPD